MSLIIKENETIVIEDIGASHISLQNYASVRHIFTTIEETKNLTVDLGLGASYTAIFLQKNNDFSLTVNLNSPKARADIASIFTANKNQKCAATINHNASDTYSNQLFKGISLGQGISDMALKTFVEKDIKSVEAYQLLRGIVLDKTSQIKSAPLLDIYSDDVICSHGCAIGVIDEDMLFYMQSRGIDKESACKILISSFCSEVTDKIEDEIMLEKLQKYIASI